MRLRPADALGPVTRRTVRQQRRGRDALTALPTRDHFRHALAAAVRSTARGETSSGILFCDLDDFKQVNDACGHADGDRLLRQVGDRLRASLRPGDAAARLGGDEFAVLLRGRREPSEVLAAAHELSRALAAPYRLEARSVTCPASIGVAVLSPEDARGVTPGSEVRALEDRVDDVLRQADLAMYEAKAAGSGQVLRFEPEMLEQALRRARAMAGLERALDAMRIGLVFQPIYDAATGRLVAAESSVRFTDPDEPLLDHPAELLRLAESIDRIDVVTKWVLGAAIRAAAGWPPVAGGDVEVTVNLSPRQLAPTWLVPTLRDLLDEHGVEPGRLVVELTESSGRIATSAARRAVRRLRELGVRIDLDDVGTRFSALSDLRELAVDGLKIDRGFVMSVDRDPAAAAVVRGVAAIGAELGLRVTAEGVDRPAVHELVLSRGCTRVQGYLFSPPLDEEAFLAFLEREHESPSEPPARSRV